MNAPSITTTAQSQAVTRNFDLSAALKDAFKTALITLGLSIPILSYKTDQSGADLFLTPRWGLVAIICAIVFGLRLVLHAFTAAVLGGIGSLPGAVLGGLIIGLIETFWSAYFSIEYKDVAAFSILAIVLIFMPSGILGRPEVEKV